MEGKDWSKGIFYWLQNELIFKTNGTMHRRKCHAIYLSLKRSWFKTHELRIYCTLSQYCIYSGVVCVLA